MGWNDVGDTYQGREKRWERVREPPGNMAPSGWVYINFTIMIRFKTASDRCHENREKPYRFTIDVSRPAGNGKQYQQNPSILSCGLDHIPSSTFNSESHQAQKDLSGGVEPWNLYLDRS